MNKSELIQDVAERTGVAKSQVATVVDALFNSDNGAIVSALRRGDNVGITGFGSFRTSQRAARKGRNPQTGKEINISASTAAGFTAGKGLKESLNKKGR
jgi:DNA-binding protein HU-beta